MPLNVTPKRPPEAAIVAEPPPIVVACAAPASATAATREAPASARILHLAPPVRGSAPCSGAEEGPGGALASEIRAGGAGGEARRPPGGRRARRSQWLRARAPPAPAPR